MKRRVAGSALALCTFLTPAVQGDCKCHQPEKRDETRWGGNEAVVVVPNDHFRELKGIVEVFDKELVQGALAEVFDKPDYLVGDTPWDQRPQQHRLRACVTTVDGKFCFRDLPNGKYELRISRDQGWNVSHVYVVVDRDKGTREPLRVSMKIGT